MPFLSLGDSQQFSNLGKIWIFVVAAIASTALTFLGSAAWDKIRENHRSQPNPHAGEARLFDNDARVLEPIPHEQPSAQQLIQQVINIAGKGDDRADDDADDSTREDGGIPDTN